MTLGKVYLVGAGPGDPLLITVRGVECVSRADLVLYDYLVNPQILEHARPDAQCECLGRHGQGRIVPQEEINARLIQQARQGQIVVRLKSGDPAIFARGSEETTALAEAGIPFEIVPGITAALAAGSYAGIPITHRDLASGVALITGQECLDKSESSLDFSSLARFSGTLVFYMGVTTAPKWSQALIEAGKPAETPVAIIRRCSWPDQKTVHCTLGEVKDVLAAGKMRPPAIVIVGAVVALDQTVHWFEQKPLIGKTVLVTRPVQQAREMRAKLAELGAHVLLQSAITISDPSDWQPVDQAIGQLPHFDYVVFSSSNGVEYFLNRLLQQGYDLRQLAATKIAAIGPATAEKLAQFHLHADIQPDEYRAEALAEQLADSATGKRFLLVRASRGREVLAETLRSCGGDVQQVVTYTSSDTPQAEDEALERLQQGNIDWVTVTSSAIARSLIRLFGDDLKQTRLASISPITSQVLQEAGFPPAVEAKKYTTAGMIDEILGFDD